MDTLKVTRPSFLGQLKAYLLLSKPGILFGNAVTAMGGFAAASKGSFDLSLFFATLTGLSLIIASACSFNNYIDRDADKKMLRTQRRVLVSGMITPVSALFYATITALLGILVLAALVGTLTLIVALLGFAVYVFVYSFLKYQTTSATLIGSIAGAVPPVVGYCAVSQCLDLGALLLFLMIALWQMPHFFAISLYRLEDYAAASIPVLPVVKGIKATKIHMLLYVVAFVAASLSLCVFGYAGKAYALFAAGFGCVWIVLAIKGLSPAIDDKKWGRAMFIFSLIIVTLLCALLIF